MSSTCSANSEPWGLNLLRGAASAGDRLLVGPYYESHGQARRAPLVCSKRRATASSSGLCGMAGSLHSGKDFASLGPIGSDSKIDLTARLTGQVTVSVGPRIQRDEMTGRISRSIMFQIALKT